MDRCGALFPALKTLERPVRELSELRNAAVHAGSAPARIEAKAINALHEVVLACCTTLSILPDDLAPGYGEVLRLVPKMTDNITFRVACRIASHRASFDRLARRIP